LQQIVRGMLVRHSAANELPQVVTEVRPDRIGRRVHPKPHLAGVHVLLLAGVQQPAGVVQHPGEQVQHIGTQQHTGTQQTGTQQAAGGQAPGELHVSLVSVFIVFSFPMVGWVETSVQPLHHYRREEAEKDARKFHGEVGPVGIN
jgi:hypothetical protein